MRRTSPECNSCGTPMEPTTVPGDGLVGWFCLACKRFRPQYDDVTLNNTSIESEEK